MKLVVVAAVLVGGMATVGVASVGAAGDGPGLGGRSFTVTAAAFPVDPAPGANQTSLGVRPVAVRAQRSAPPDAAYARSAFADPGTAEIYTGPPPEGSFAECDTALENQPREATVATGTAHLSVSCGDPGQVWAVATGASPGGQQSFRSEVRITVAGGRLAASAVTEAAGLEVGPLRLGGARYVGSVSTDGSRARAAGVIEVTDATVAGIPVRLAADGVSVDEARVPLELVATAADALHRALSSSGYFGMRVVQPATSVSDDGSHAEVTGGGIELLARTNDPTNNYYLSFTLLGGELRLDLGGGEPTVEPPAAPTPGGELGPGSAEETPAPGLVTPPPAPEGAGSAHGGQTARLSLSSARQADRAPGRWPGLGWVALLVALAPPGLLVASWRLPRLRESLAERYVRG
jgi:hypothetical protein